MRPHQIATGAVTGLLDALDPTSYHDWAKAGVTGMRQTEAAIAVRRLNAEWPLADALPGLEGATLLRRLIQVSSAPTAAFGVLRGAYSRGLSRRQLSDTCIRQRLVDLVDAAVASQHYAMLTAVSELERLLQVSPDGLQLQPMWRNGRG